MKRANLSIFVPHMGCPNRCSFCDQNSISGELGAPEPHDVARLCKKAQGELRGRGYEAEIAFFGGSFTAIDRVYMCSLLAAAAPFVGDVFSGIRISTRPDCIDGQTLTLLKGYNVKTIELGAQSMSDRVLSCNRRGHTAADVERASQMIRSMGFSLGLQMMTGLYGASESSDMESAGQLAELEPDFVRVYPTLVLEGSELAQLWRAGEYRPQTLEEAVSLGARLLRLFEHRYRIPVIRMGLHAEASLEQELLAGPYHPAFRELCEGELLCSNIVERVKEPGSYCLRISPKTCSKLTGHGARGIEKLRKIGYHIKIIQDTGLSGSDFVLEEM